MCNLITYYHTKCQCYGTPTVDGEPCIRAQTAVGCSKCWNTIDLGVQSVCSWCPKCAKEFRPGSVVELPLSPFRRFELAVVSATAIGRACRT